MTTNFYLPEKPELKNLVQHVFQVDGLTPFSKEIIFSKGITNSTSVVLGTGQRMKSLPFYFSTADTSNCKC
jgi:hypothetical protein